MNHDEHSQRVVRAESLAALAISDHGWDVYARILSFKELTTRRGDPYLVVELGDLDTVLEAKIWSNQTEAMDAVRQLRPQTPVKVRGTAKDYQGRLQLEIERIKAVDPARDADFDPARLVDPALELVEDLVCRTLVVDIETVPAYGRDDLPEDVLDTLRKFAVRKEPSDKQEVVDSLVQRTMSFSPFFGRVVSIAIGDGDADPAVPATGDPAVTVLAVPPDGVTVAEPPAWLRLMDERTLLASFWALAGKADVVVTFNGRSFDVPFLVTRSLIQGVPARRDLVSGRYSLKPHLDLWELLSQRDRGPSKLDVVCWALGIDSPKGDMDGSMVAPTYARGDIVKIAHYNAQDVRATAAVYRKVRDLVLRYRTDWS